MLDDEINNILEKLDVYLTTLELRCRFCEKPHNFEEERKLRLSAKEKKNEIKRLKEVKNKEDELLNDDVETKISKLLTDLEYEKHNAFHDITVLESKWIKLEMSPAQIDRIKDLILSSWFMLL